MSTIPSKEFLMIKCHLDVSCAEAFRAWSDPRELSQWWGPDEGDNNVVVDMDVRKGGTYHVATEAPNGDHYDFSGEYKEVIPNRVISFTWDTGSEKEGSIVTAKLNGDGDGTELTLIHEGLADETEREQCRDGWQGALKKLKRQLGA